MTSLPEQSKNYILEAALDPLNFKTKKDQVIRTLSVPANITFHQLHAGLRLAFKWNGEHAYHFTVRNCTEWRTMTQVSKAKELLQLCQIDHRRDYNCGVPHRRADYTILESVLDDPLYAGKKISYLWDFCERWEHTVTVMGRTEASTGMRLLSGKGKPPPHQRRGVNVFNQTDMDGVNKKLDRYTLKHCVHPPNPSVDPIYFGGLGSDEDGNNYTQQTVGSNVEIAGNWHSQGLNANNEDQLLQIPSSTSFLPRQPQEQNQAPRPVPQSIILQPATGNQLKRPRAGEAEKVADSEGPRYGKESYQEIQSRKKKVWEEKEKEKEEEEELKKKKKKKKKKGLITGDETGEKQSKKKHKKESEEGGEEDAKRDIE
ncbi:hypothetical protein EG329_004026 [Mollisiaceae sp. DMI_Dod_QoI]|nr:hypothetical protein EG329_004026 [Helotiales sp. DMI_Dod_QoI]